MISNKITGENIMSLKKSAARRISLLAGSSLVAAGLSLAASVSFTLAPSAAWAIDECQPVTGSGTTSDGAGGASDPALNGTAADSFQCPAGSYATGISYSSNGALTVGMAANGAVVNSTITANGVNLTGSGADSVTWNSTVGNITGTTATAGPLIDVSSVSGAINISTAGVNANQAGSTHGIRATSTGGADITIGASAVSNNVAGAQAAVQAVTNGGDISISMTGGATGRLRGILAQTSGSGSIGVTLNGGANASGVDGVAAVDLIAGAGPVNLTWNGGGVSGGAGDAIRAVAASGVTIQSNTGTLFGRVDFSGVTGSGVDMTITSTSIVNGYWAASGSSIFSNQSDTVTLNGYAVNSTLSAGSSIDFAGGADVFNIDAKMTSNGTLNFGDGADTLNVNGTLYAHGATINFGSGDDTFNASGIINKDYSSSTGVLNLDFGSGNDTFNQSGILIWNGGTISNLEAFNNSGTIYLGGQQSQTGSTVYNNGDGDAADTLVLSSGVFTGSGDSRIVIEANLDDHGSQIGCSTPTVAECVNFTGASTAGSTQLLIQDLSYSIDGGTLGTVVTVIQGSSAAENFVLDPASDYYGMTSQGQAIRKPMVAYRLVYDAANQRHVLLGAPTDEVEQASVLAVAGQEIWRATTGSWLTRQADLRATPGGLAPSAGFWARGGGQASEREGAAVYDVSGLTLDYDLGHKQRIAHLAFGADLVGGSGWVIGGAVGFARSDIEFDVTPTEASTTGYTGGLYASFVSGPMFVDAVASLNLMHVKADTPDLGLGLDVPMKFDLKSLGGQVEAGWRIPMGGLFVEPLAGVSYVVTRIEDAEVPGGSGLFDFDEAESLRLGAGARIGLDSRLMGMAAGYSLTGRYWDETAGDAAATITTASGSSAPLLDELSGGFSEIAASLNLYSSEGGVSGFVNLGGKFGDDYKAVDGSAGVRVRW